MLLGIVGGGGRAVSRGICKDGGTGEGGVRLPAIGVSEVVWCSGVLNEGFG